METCVNISCANNKYPTSKGPNRGAAAAEGRRHPSVGSFAGGVFIGSFAGGVFIGSFAGGVGSFAGGATENLADVDMILEKKMGSALKLIKKRLFFRKLIHFLR